MSRKYNVVASTRPEYVGMMVPLDVPEVGETVSLFGEDFTVTQGGAYPTLSQPLWVIAMQEVEPEKPEEDDELRINHNVDLFFDDKVVDVRSKTTYKDLYEFLKKEWNHVRFVSGEVFPFEYDYDYDVLRIYNGWNLTPTAVSNLTGGSYSRYDDEGRSI